MKKKPMPSSDTEDCHSEQEHDFPPEEALHIEIASKMESEHHVLPIKEISKEK